MGSQYPDPSSEGYQVHQQYNPLPSSQHQSEPALPSLNIVDEAGIDLSDIYRHNQQAGTSHMNGEETPRSDFHAVSLEDSNDNNDTSVFGGLPNMQSFNASSHGDQSQFSTTHQGFLTQEVENAVNNMPPPIPRQQYGNGHQQHQYSSYSNQKPSPGSGRDADSRPPLQQRNLNSGRPEANTPFPQQLGPYQTAQAGFHIYDGQQGLLYQPAPPSMSHGPSQGLVAQPFMYQPKQPPVAHPANTYVPPPIANNQAAQTQQLGAAPPAPKKEKPNILQVFKRLTSDKDSPIVDYDSLAITDREVVLSWKVLYHYNTGQLALVLQYFDQVSRVLGRLVVVRILRRRAMRDANEPGATLHPLDPFVKFQTTNGVPTLGYVLTNDVTPQQYPADFFANGPQQRTERFKRGAKWHGLAGYPQSFEPIPIGKTCAEVIREYPNHCHHEGMDAFIQHDVGADGFIQTLKKAENNPINPNTVLKDMVSCGSVKKVDPNFALKRVHKRLEVMVKKFGIQACKKYYEERTAIMLREPGDMIVPSSTVMTSVGHAVSRLTENNMKHLPDETDQRDWHRGSGSVFAAHHRVGPISNALQTQFDFLKQHGSTVAVRLPKFKLTSTSEYKRNNRIGINAGRLPQGVVGALQVGVAPGFMNAQAAQQSASTVGQAHQVPAANTQAAQHVIAAGHQPQQTPAISSQTTQPGGTSSTQTPIDPQLLNQSAVSDNKSGDGDDNSNGASETVPNLDTEEHQVHPTISCSIKDGRLGSFNGLPIWDSESEYLSKVTPLLGLSKQVHVYGDVLVKNMEQRDMTKSRYL